MVPAAGPRRGRGAAPAPHRTRLGPRDGVVPGGSVRRWSLSPCALVLCVCEPAYSRVRFPVSSVVPRGTRQVHRGCFVWTPTPPLSGRRTPRPSLVRVSLGSFFLAGPGGLVFSAYFSASHLSLGCFLLLLCSAPSRPGLPLACPLVCLLSFLYCFFPFFLPSSRCASAVSCFLWFPGPGILGLGAVWPPSPYFFLPGILPTPAWFGVCFLTPTSSSSPPVFSGRLLLPPPPLFALWVSRCWALRVLPLLSFFLPGLWRLPCSYCTPPSWCLFRGCRPCRSAFRAFPLLFCSCLFAWRSSAVLAPPPPIRALSLVLSGVPALCRPFVWCSIRCCRW